MSTVGVPSSVSLKFVFELPMDMSGVPLGSGCRNRVSLSMFLQQKCVGVLQGNFLLCLVYEAKDLTTFYLWQHNLALMFTNIIFGDTSHHFNLFCIFLYEIISKWSLEKQTYARLPFKSDIVIVFNSYVLVIKLNSFAWKMNWKLQ